MQQAWGAGGAGQPLRVWKGPLETSIWESRGQEGEAGAEMALSRERASSERGPQEGLWGPPSQWQLQDSTQLMGAEAQTE